MSDTRHVHRVTVHISDPLREDHDFLQRPSGDYPFVQVPQLQITSYPVDTEPLFPHPAVYIQAITDQVVLELLDTATLDPKAYLTRWSYLNRYTTLRMVQQGVRERLERLSAKVDFVDLYIPECIVEDNLKRAEHEKTIKSVEALTESVEKFKDKVMPILGKKEEAQSKYVEFKIGGETLLVVPDTLKCIAFDKANGGLRTLHFWSNQRAGRSPEISYNPDNAEHQKSVQGALAEVLRRNPNVRLMVAYEYKNDAVAATGWLEITNLKVVEAVNGTLKVVNHGRGLQQIDEMPRVDLAATYSRICEFAALAGLDFNVQAGTDVLQEAGAQIEHEVLGESGCNLQPDLPKQLGVEHVIHIENPHVRVVILRLLKYIESKGIGKGDDQKNGPEDIVAAETALRVLQACGEFDRKFYKTAHENLKKMRQDYITQANKPTSHTIDDVEIDLTNLSRIVFTQTVDKRTPVVSFCGQKDGVLNAVLLQYELNVPSRIFDLRAILETSYQKMMKARISTPRVRLSSAHNWPVAVDVTEVHCLESILGPKDKHPRKATLKLYRPPLPVVAMPAGYDIHQTVETTAIDAARLVRLNALACLVTGRVCSLKLPHETIEDASRYAYAAYAELLNDWYKELEEPKQKEEDQIEGPSVPLELKSRHRISTRGVVAFWLTLDPLGSTSFEVLYENDERKVMPFNIGDGGHDAYIGAAVKIIRSEAEKDGKGGIPMYVSFAHVESPIEVSSVTAVVEYPRSLVLGKTNEDGPFEYVTTHFPEPFDMKKVHALVNLGASACGSKPAQYRHDDGMAVFGEDALILNLDVIHFNRKTFRGWHTANARKSYGIQSFVTLGEEWKRVVEERTKRLLPMPKFTLAELEAVAGRFINVASLTGVVVEGDRLLLTLGEEDDWEKVVVECASQDAASALWMDIRDLFNTLGIQNVATHVTDGILRIREQEYEEGEVVGLYWTPKGFRLILNCLNSEAYKLDGRHVFDLNEEEGRDLFDWIDKSRKARGHNGALLWAEGVPDDGTGTRYLDGIRYLLVDKREGENLCLYFCNETGDVDRDMYFEDDVEELDRVTNNAFAAIKGIGRPIEIRHGAWPGALSDVPLTDRERSALEEHRKHEEAVAAEVMHFIGYGSVHTAEVSRVVVDINMPGVLLLNDSDDGPSGHSAEYSKLADYREVAGSFERLVEKRKALGLPAPTLGLRRLSEELVRRGLPFMDHDLTRVDFVVCGVVDDSQYFISLKALVDGEKKTLHELRFTNADRERGTFLLLQLTYVIDHVLANRKVQYSGTEVFLDPAQSFTDKEQEVGEDDTIGAAADEMFHEVRFEDDEYEETWRHGRLMTGDEVEAFHDVDTDQAVIYEDSGEDFDPDEWRREQYDDDSEDDSECEFDGEFERDFEEPYDPGDGPTEE